jgi:hypothetical protein
VREENMKKEYDFSKFRKVDRDRFKNAKFEYASTDIVDRFAEIKSEFMKNIFELPDEDYLISDESLLSDMFMDWAEEEIRERTKEKYGINIEDVGNTLFCDIFSRIHQNKKSI